MYVVVKLDIPQAVSNHHIDHMGILHTLAKVIWNLKQYTRIEMRICCAYREIDKFNKTLLFHGYWRHAVPRPSQLEHCLMHREHFIPTQKIK